MKMKKSLQQNTQNKN
uniref:Uncharacterized protein n=1 Tax=Rhizophora mucronata TaxID=61149 RepID=A0A2P2R2C5_RHIMU